MIIRYGENEIIKDDAVVLRECLGCLNCQDCKNDLIKGNIFCYFLYNLYTRDESFREEYYKELEEECDGD